MAQLAALAVRCLMPRRLAAVRPLHPDVSCPCAHGGPTGGACSHGYVNVYRDIGALSTRDVCGECLQERFKAGGGIAPRSAMQ